MLFLDEGLKNLRKIPMFYLRTDNDRLFGVTCEETLTVGIFSSSCPLIYFGQNSLASLCRLEMFTLIFNTSYCQPSVIRVFYASNLEGAGVFIRDTSWDKGSQRTAVPDKRSGTLGHVLLLYLFLNGEPPNISVWHG